MPYNYLFRTDANFFNLVSNELLNFDLSRFGIDIDYEKKISNDKIIEILNKSNSIISKFIFVVSPQEPACSPEPIFSIPVFTVNVDAIMSSCVYFCICLCSCRNNWCPSITRTWCNS